MEDLLRDPTSWSWGKIMLGILLFSIYMRLASIDVTLKKIWRDGL